MFKENQLLCYGGIVTKTVLGENGQMHMTVVYDGCIKNRMDLRNFPFDSDNIEITAWALFKNIRSGSVEEIDGKKEYRCVLEGCRVVDDLCLPADFAFVSIRIDDVKSEWDFYLDTIKVSVTVSRGISYYMVKVVVPLVLIVILDMLGFCAQQDLGDHLSYISGLFLAAVASIYIVSCDLPRLMYQTALDRLIMVTVITLTATAVHAVVGSQHQDADYEEGLSSYQVTTMVCYTTLYTLYLLVDFGRNLISRHRGINASTASMKSCMQNHSKFVLPPAHMQERHQRIIDDPCFDSGNT